MSMIACICCVAVAALGQADTQGAKPKALYPLERELNTAPPRYAYYLPGHQEDLAQWKEGLDHELETLERILSAPPPNSTNIILHLEDSAGRARAMQFSALRFEKEGALLNSYTAPLNLRAWVANDGIRPGEYSLQNWLGAQAIVSMGNMAPHPTLFKRLEEEVPREPDLRLIAFILHTLDGSRIGLFRLEEEIRLTHADPRTGWVTGRKNKLANLQVLKEWFEIPDFFEDRKNWPKPARHPPELLEKHMAEARELRRTGGFDDGSPPKPKP